MPLFSQSRASALWIVITILGCLVNTATNVLVIFYGKTRFLEVDFLSPRVHGFVTLKHPADLSSIWHLLKDTCASDTRENWIFLKQTRGYPCPAPLLLPTTHWAIPRSPVGDIPLPLSLPLSSLPPTWGTSPSLDLACESLCLGLPPYPVPPGWHPLEF